MTNAKPTRVLVLWADNHSKNLGVRVLAQGMGELARRSWGPDVEVSFQDFAPGDSSTGFGGRAILRDIGRRDGALKAKIRGYDAVLDSGAGDSFTDIYGTKRLTIMNYAHRVATRAGVPIAMGPQTIGPFESRVGKTIAKTSLSRMSVVVARDSSSAQFSNAFGYPVDALSTDVVFALSIPPRSNDLDVIVNASGLLWNENRHVDSGKYRSQMIDLCEGLIARGRHVTLLAHVLDNPSRDNDVPAVHALSSILKGRADVIVPTDLDDARKILASARLVIGSRMHACLNAMSVGTPAISWAYSRKFAPLMQDIGWSHGFELKTEPNVADKTLRLIDSEPESLMSSQLDDVQRRTAERLEAAARALSSILHREMTQ